MGTKIKILETAVRLSGEKGLHALNARVIAKELGIASSNVFYHFKTQEELKHAVYARVMESAARYVEVEMQAVASECPLSKLKAYCDGTLRWGAHNPDELRFFLHGIVETTGELPSNGFSEQALSNGLSSLESLIALFLVSEKKAADRFGSLELLAKQIHSMLIGVTLRLYVFKEDRKQFEDIRNSLWMNVETTLNSL